MPGRAFCELPEGNSHEHRAIILPPLDAIVGNPPYVRQEKVSKDEKLKLSKRVEEAFPGTVLRGRADLHCYFWPHACRFLKEGGYFGFLTSGQWLDVDYGFALQRWILSNFQVVAVLESATERWFPDARVKTCVTILRRCSDPEKRRSNLVRFVRFEKPLTEIIGVLPSGGVGKEAEIAEVSRQSAVDAIRDELERLTHPVHEERWRVLLKSQAELWDEGVRAGEVLKPGAIPATAEGDEEEEEVSEETSESAEDWLGGHHAQRDYVAGKWGRFLRAPDLYFELMNRFRGKFAILGGITDVRRGITSGCDKFFMPLNVTGEILAAKKSDKEFKKLTGASRPDAESGVICIIKDGAGTLHAIESEYVKPEVHSLMKINRPVVNAKDFNRVVLMVSGTLPELRGTHVYNYIKHGESATYASKNLYKNSC